MKKKWEVKFVFDMRGFWPDERVDGGIWNLKNPLFKLVYYYFKKKEKQFLSAADHIISLTHNAKQVIHSWPGIKNQPVQIQVIPCCVDLNLFDPAKIYSSDTDRLKTELQIPQGVTILSYIGSIGTWYMLPEMLAFYKRWLLKKPDTVLLFVTNAAADAVISAAGNAGIPASAIRTQSAARNEVPLFISLCDYSIFFIKPVFSKRASSPTKQAEIMAMGKPLICNSNVGDTDYVISKYRSGIQVHEFTDADYDKAVNEMIVPGRFNANEIRNGAKAFFSLDEGIRHYDEVYRAVLNGK
jgi:glycosyltransferase involved in cell wall biosynthesis